MMRFAAMALMTALITLRGSADTPDASGVIQTVALDPMRPYFIPTHPRVTTTIRFPGEIGAPDGSIAVFTEDAGKQAGEYLVTWQQGDSYLTLTPLKEAPMANLNVPFQRHTYVLYFYQVVDPLKAVASVNLVAESERPAMASPAATNPSGPTPVTRQSTPPPDDFVAPSAARLVGLLDRLKVIHATPLGPALVGLATAMNVQIAINAEDRAVPESVDRAVTYIRTGTNDAGLYQIHLLRVVRDHRLNALGFVCLVRNTSDQELLFDVSSFGARAGAQYLVQRISDATPRLQPGEQAPAYFIVTPSRHAPLLATNDWRISVDLVRPRLNPGAVIARGFAPPETPR